MGFFLQLWWNNSFEMTSSAWYRPFGIERDLPLCKVLDTPFQSRSGDNLTNIS